MFGASIYLSSDLEKIFEYLEELSQFGAKSIFTSFHIQEEDRDMSLKKIREVSLKAHSLNLELMVDISNNTLSKFDFTLKEMLDFLLEIKVHSLRIDFGFDFDEIEEIAKYFPVVFNASTLDEQFCSKLNLDFNKVTACHNFYPRVETGLSREFLLSKNAFLHSKNIKVQAFIPGDKEFRGPLFEGLPTIEDHRNQDPFLSYLELIQDLMVDEVLVGDISLKRSTLNRIFKFERDKIIELRVSNIQKMSQSLENEFWSVHQNRKDYSDFVIRSTKTRVNIKEDILPQNTIRRNIGSITIDNKDYLRYNGELQIALKDLPEDTRVNVVGEVIKDDLPFLKYIKDDVKFIFSEDR